MQLEIRERSVESITILDLAGRITIGEGSVQLRDAVSNLLSADRTHIILNLEAISYVDSSGIGELISRFTTTKNSGGHLKLLKVPKKIKDLLMITKLLTVFEIHEDETTAVNSFLK
jgi:anti-sigma B factor antagonist